MTRTVASAPSGNRTPTAILAAESPLEAVQRHVLWIATNVIHHANRVRPNPSGIKVGGHQASSASVVTIMTELFFDFMAPGDRLSVKPHASPVLHAIQYLLGNLDRSYLTRLREFHGLQAYPSRTKDPDPVDFSTGSVGLGAVAPNFAALVNRLVDARFRPQPGPRRRFIALVGDAELDEGSIWEAMAEPALAGLENVLWIVDVNRQSLDRVVPGLRVRQLEQMFAACGWTVVEAKYGKRLQAAFERPDGERLREAIDKMSNEEYQLLLRSAQESIADALGDAADGLDGDLRPLIADLGGHDFATLREALVDADRAPGPAVVFAYTIKGWGLPIAADPLNHSALLTSDQVASLRADLGFDSTDEWPALQGAAAELIEARRASFLPRRSTPRSAPALPVDLDRGYSGQLSTQRAFGHVLMALARTAPEAAERIVTVSPDVASSTNLGGWINKVGVWSPAASPDIFSSLGSRLIEWRTDPRGQHIELGISETNLMMLLGQLGQAADTCGEPLLPIGTVYDPFIARGLDALNYALYSGGRFVLVGTPSGITLAPEGGAHQSISTPTIGIAQPQLTYWEPCFAQDLEWILLHALALLHDPAEGGSSYLRLSTAPIDQGLLPTPVEREAHRRAVLSGVYPLCDRSQARGARPDNRVDIWATGVMVPPAIRAADELLLDGVYASVWNCVSPDRVYRAWQAEVHSSLAEMRPRRRGTAPVVTVIDGHPSALAWVGSMLGVRAYPLGVTDFGQSGTPADLYAEFRIDSESICLAAYAALNA